MQYMKILADVLDPSQAVSTLSNTLLGAIVVLLLVVCGYLLRGWLKEKDNSLTIMREVLTAVNNFTSVQKEINDRNNQK